MGGEPTVDNFAKSDTPARGRTSWSSPMDRTIVKRVGVALLAVCFAAAAAAGCADRRHQDRFKWGEILASIVTSKQATGGPVYLDVMRVMPFEWEKFYMFPPYTPVADVERALGFRWGTAQKTRIHERDDITLLVFVIGRTVQDYIEQPRGAGDFSRLKPGYAYPPREGYFECVAEEEDGRTVFYFVEAQRYR
jgi:hypothetical protein